MHPKSTHMKKTNKEDDQNHYLRYFDEKVNISESISMESIELLLANMTNLHNTVGKSYEYVATSKITERNLKS